MTSAISVEEKFEFTNNDMVLGVANYLNTNDHEDIAHIKKSLSPVLLNSVSSTVSIIESRRIILIDQLDVKICFAAICSVTNRLLLLQKGNLELLKKL